MSTDVIEHDDDTGAERCVRGSGALERQRHVDLVGAHEYTCCAAQQNRLHGATARMPPANASRRASGPERHLVDAWLFHRARDAEQFRPGRLISPDRRERRSALEHDERYIGQRLDVVDDRGPPEQPGLGGERWLVSRLTAQSFDRVEERCLLAANVRARAFANLDVEGNATTPSRCAPSSPRDRARSIACCIRGPRADTHRECRHIRIRRRPRSRQWSWPPRL